MQGRSKISLSDLELDIQATLAAVNEIDRWYNLEREKLGSYPEAIRNEIATEIEQRRRLNRQPYVLHLAHLHQMIVSTRIFGDPTVPLHSRRSGYSTLPKASQA